MGEGTVRGRRDAAPIRFCISDVVRAEPEAVFAWWTDVGEDDAGNVMPPLLRRTIVRRTAAETETEDLWSIFGVPFHTRATLRPHPPHGWEVVTELRGGRARDVAHVEAVSGGTRVTVDMEMALRPPWSWAVRALRTPLGRLFRADLRAVNCKLEAFLASRQS